MKIQKVHFESFRSLNHFLQLNEYKTDSEQFWVRNSYTKYVNQPTNSRHALKKSVENMDLSRILLAVKSI